MRFLVERKQEDPQSRRLHRTPEESIVLNHHMLQILVIGDGDQGVKVLSRELVFEAENIRSGIADGGELRKDGGEFGIAVDCEDFGVAANVGKLIVVRTGLDFTAIAAHELDLVRGGGVVPRRKVIAVDIAGVRR
ncbi:hypothetical protein V2J09_019849 [Rumex salicifolius]